MLGSTLVKYLKTTDFNVVEFNRSGVAQESKNKVFRYEASEINSKNQFDEMQSCDFIINCIGLIKQKINENDPQSIKNAAEINTYFPIKIDEFGKKNGIKIIQIGTDCVFSGSEGPYSEVNKKDAQDIYGLTKIAGEIVNSSTMTLRCSIIGLENNSSYSLLSWFLAQPLNTSINGFTNHLWNGLTTLQFSKIVVGLLKNGLFNPTAIHIVPDDYLSKYQLLVNFSNIFERTDVKIFPVDQGTGIDRRLTTVKPDLNLQLWNSANYEFPPTIYDMVAEYAKFVKVH